MRSFDIKPCRDLTTFATKNYIAGITSGTIFTPNHPDRVLMCPDYTGLECQLLGIKRHKTIWQRLKAFFLGPIKNSLFMRKC